MLVSIFNWVIDLIVNIATFAMGILPESPFSNQTWDFSGFQQVIAWINYFLPIGWFVDILSLYLVAIGLWYVVRWFLRLTKYID